jgi:hypothetical protein
MRPIIATFRFAFLTAALVVAVAPLQAGESPRGREPRQSLGQTIQFSGIDDARATLSDALDMISKRYNLTFDINKEAFKRAEIVEVGRVEIAPIPIPPMQAKIEDVLRKILSRLSPKAAFFIRGDAIEITTTEAIRKEFFADRPQTPGPLPPLVSGLFEKVTLETALKELNRYDNVVLDARAANEGQATVSADLANVPLDTAVRMFADMAGLKVVKLDNALYVTSKENAKVLREEQEQQKVERERQVREKLKKPKEEKNPAAPKKEADARTKVR